MLSLGFNLLFAQKTILQSDPPQSYAPMASQGVFLGRIPSLKDLTPKTQGPLHLPQKLAQKRNYFFANELNNSNPQPTNGDPLVKKSNTQNPETGPELIPGLIIEGLRDPGGVSPPDPTGDVGKNHYLQMTNGGGGAWIQAWDKFTGQSVLGPLLSTTIWETVGSGSLGDPIVQYDHDAERWIILELQGFFTNELLLAISDDSDPTGGWKAYRFQTLGFGDYPKFYVWNNAYFVTVNEITNGNECSGYALERSAILAGEPTFDIYRFVMPNYQAIAYQPATGADWEGGPPPPPGSPEYIFRVYDDAWDGGQDHIQIWEVNVDWNDPAQSNITGPDKVFPTPFETKVCFGGGLFDCIEQPDTDAPRITALENIIMYRAPYRNFGTHESVVFNHVTDVSGQVGEGGDAAVRWYELRKSGGSDWQIFQEGTYAPDLVTNRFMSTICMDEAGNIALGYTGASQFLYPGAYLTGRRTSDPLGDMPVEEFTLAAGEQSHFSDSRWGDYSNMSVDPEDGRTFWYTGEYQPMGATWGTIIGSFRIQVDTYDVKPITLINPVNSALLGAGETVTVEILNGGLVSSSDVSVSLYFEGNLVASENVVTNILPGETALHTFGPSVDMPIVGKSYPFRIITRWTKDQFVRNDTLDVAVKKLTSNDVAIVGRHNLPGLVCGDETDFGIIFQNASGLPLQSAQINWQINNQPLNSVTWTGNLLPNERDTVDVHAVGIVNGLNGIAVSVSMPNGVADQDPTNNALPLTKFTGKLDGTFLTMESETTAGVLSWELRNLANILLVSGEVSAGQNFTQICSDDNTCYLFIVKASTFNWSGHLRLYDIYGNVLAEVFQADQMPVSTTICTPSRQSIDVGAFALLSPVSGPNLTVNEPVTILLRNFGLTNQSNVEVSYRVDNGAWHTETYPNMLESGSSATHTFASTEDLSIVGASYLFEIKATVLNDAQANNDSKVVSVLNRPLRELSVVGVRAVEACNDVDNVYIGVNIQNNGLGDNQQFDLFLQVNGVVQPPMPFDVVISPDERNEILVFLQGLQYGSNTVSVDITNVGGLGEDEVPSNDVGSVIFSMDADGFPILLTFGTNDLPAENRWELRDDQGVVIQSGGPYDLPFGFYNESFCVDKDKCYEFVLLDTGGNGMEGGFIALNGPDGTNLGFYSGGDFGTELKFPFCAVSACQGFTLNTATISPSGAGTNDGQITAQPTGGTAPYQFSLDGGAFQADPVFPNLGAGFYVLVCLDAQGCVQETLVPLTTSNTTDLQKPLRSLEVSPNPTSGIATITMPALAGEESLMAEVLNARGQRVQSIRLVRWDNTLRGMAILDNVPAGVYFVRVLGLQRPLTARIVKK